MIVVTETFFPVSVERVAVIVHECPSGVEEQQLEEDAAEVVIVREEVEVVQDAETEAELSGAAGPVDEEADAAVFVFQDEEPGHQPGLGPGPGPGPSLGPFCSDILSW